MAEFVLARYQGEWAIFAKTSNCYVVFGTKQEMTNRLKALNAED